MDISVPLFLTSGLFLGWTLGANHLANVFGTAIGTRMISWATAAVTCAIFVALGAVISGAGPSATLGKLGAVNAIGGAFTVALAAAIVMFWMTRLGLPVPTTQAIVGAIIGWNFFTASVTDPQTLTEIVLAWIAGPLIAAVVAILLLKVMAGVKRCYRPHLLRADAYTRIGLWIAGAFGAYSLGANNIANVMGVFVPVTPFSSFSVGNLFSLSPVELLFLLGGIAIAVGVLTYSRRVVHTIGSELLDMSPLAAWIIVMAHSIVLFIFSSEGLEHLLASHGLPTLPLVPMSSSVVVIGAVIGIGLYHSGRQIRWRSLGRIGLAWLISPILAGIICFVGLFVMQNLFLVPVHQQVSFAITPPVEKRMAAAGLPMAPLADLGEKTFRSAVAFRNAIRQKVRLTEKQESEVLRLAEISPIHFEPEKVATLAIPWLTPAQQEAVRELSGKLFPAKWAVAEALAGLSAEWKPRPDTKINKLHNRQIEEGLALIYQTFGAPLQAPAPGACPCTPETAPRQKEQGG
jgi:PiT family inorganic phosphate transporter